MDAELISEEELDRRLGRCDPVNRAAIGDERFRAAVAKLQRGIEAEARGRVPSSSVRRPRHRSGHRRRWTALGVAATAAAVASLVGVETLTGGSGGAGLPFAVSPAAAAQLERIAHAASAQRMPAAWQWEYLEIELENVGAISIWSPGNPALPFSIGGKADGHPAAGHASAIVTYSDTQTEQDWFAPDGSARQRDSTVRFAFATPRDRATYLAHRSEFDDSHQFSPEQMTLGAYEDRFFPSQGASQPSWGRTPPASPKRLVTDIWDQYVSANGGTSRGQKAQRPETLWISLTDLLLSSTSARLRATAYRALAYVPYTKILGARRDQLGRSGIAIDFTHDSTGTIQTLIVSPATGDLLELDRTQKRDGRGPNGDGLPAGTVSQRELFLHRAIVPAAVSLPGGGYQPLEHISTTTTATTTTAIAPATSTKASRDR